MVPICPAIPLEEAVAGASLAGSITLDYYSLSLVDRLFQLFGGMPDGRVLPGYTATTILIPGVAPAYGVNTIVERSLTGGRGIDVPRGICPHPGRVTPRDHPRSCRDRRHRTQAGQSPQPREAPVHSLPHTLSSPSPTASLVGK